MGDFYHRASVVVILAKRVLRLLAVVLRVGAVANVEAKRVLTRRYEIPPQPSAHASALGFSFFLLVQEVGDEVDGGRERRLAVEEAREGVEEKARRPDEVAEKYAVAREHPALDTVEPD